MPLNRSTTQTEDPMLNCNFLVKIGKTEYGFEKVSGLKRARENFTYQEGGVNDRVHIFPGPIKQGGTLILERGVYQGEKFPLYNMGDRIPDSITIELWDQFNKAPKRRYCLTGLVVRSWEVGDLDAGQGQVLIDRVELDYGFMCIENY